MKQTIFPTSRTSRNLYKRIEESWGFSTQPNGQEEIFYKTEIDLDLLDGMARNAAANKNGKCRDGALIVTILSRAKL